MTTNRLQALLGGRRVLDGGYGWLLQERGLPPGEPAEGWNLDRADAVFGLHEEYAAAGAGLLTTNSFGGSRPRLAAHGLDGRTAEVNAAAARIARGVADRYGIMVAGCVGPTGELLEPFGALSADEAEAVFAEQIAALADAGADLVLVETMSDLGEAEAALRAAQATAPGLPVLVTMSFDTNLHTMMGVSPGQAVVGLAGLGADAVGANCGRGPEEMERIAVEMLAVRPPGVLLAAQSNAGLPQPVGDRFVYDVPPAGMAAHARRLDELGVDLIGACCGSSPGHVAAMAQAVDAHQPA